MFTRPGKMTIRGIRLATQALELGLQGHGRGLEGLRGARAAKAAEILKPKRTMIEGHDCLTLCYTHTRTYIYIYICMYVCIYICIYICMYIYVYIYIQFIYIYIQYMYCTYIHIALETLNLKYYRRW